MKRLTLYLAFTFLTIFSSYAQQSDTVTVIDSIPKHSPTKATIMSLVVPGLGQAYNKKYWKIPVVYALIGSSLDFALDQQSKFTDYKEAYVKRVDDDPNTIDNQFKELSNQAILGLIDEHREYRDLFFVLTGVAYILNVVDAAVDAHLFYFDVSDDISGNIRPTLQQTNTAFGRQQQLIPSFTLTLKFAKKHRRNTF